MNVSNNDTAPTLKTATAARQGVTGHNVRYVLGFGLAGTIAAFILVGTYLGLQ
jgi:hypothetical protein